MSLSPSPALGQAAILGNGSFEAPVIDTSYLTVPAGQAIGEWNVTAGDVDIQYTWAQAEDGRQSLDMAGTQGGEICQSFATMTGATYDVSFQMSRNTFSGLSSASLDAIVTGITSLPFTHDAPTDNSDPVWQPHVFGFTATGGTSELCFASTEPPVGVAGDAGAMLDHVTVERFVEPDVTPPAVSLATPAVAGTPGGATPTFSGTAGNAPGDSPVVTVRIHGGPTTSGPLVQSVTTTRSGPSWSVTLTAPLAPGTYTAQAEQADAAGNVGVSSPITFTVTGETGGAGQAPGPPTAGKTFNAEPVSGVITFRCGSGPRRRLEEAEQLPIGCRIDARRGKVRVTSAAGNGTTQSAVFTGGVFVVKQKAGRSRSRSCVWSASSRTARGGAARRARRLRGPSRRRASAVDDYGAPARAVSGRAGAAAPPP